jgi:excisionase family DNA binding protein
MDFPKGKGNSNHGVTMLLSIKEAAGELGIGRDSVVRLIHRGELACVEFPRMGGTGRNKKRMVEEDEIKRFKQRNGGRG